MVYKNNGVLYRVFTYALPCIHRNTKYTENSSLILSPYTRLVSYTQKIQRNTEIHRKFLSYIESSHTSCLVYREQRRWQIMCRWSFPLSNHLASTCWLSPKKHFQIHFFTLKNSQKKYFWKKGDRTFADGPFHCLTIWRPPAHCHQKSIFYKKTFAQRKSN